MEKNTVQGNIGKAWLCWLSLEGFPLVESVAFTLRDGGLENVASEIAEYVWIGWNLLVFVYLRLSLCVCLYVYKRDSDEWAIFTRVVLENGSSLNLEVYDGQKSQEISLEENRTPREETDQQPTAFFSPFLFYEEMQFAEEMEEHTVPSPWNS